MAGHLLKYRYELQARLSEGGFCETWRGRDRLNNETVVVKLLRTGYAAREQPVQLWSRRLHRLRNVAVPHCPKVVECGRDGARAFYVREHAEGETLERWMDRPHPLAEVFDVAEAMLRVVAEWHSVGLAHGRLHPGNLVLTEQGPVICDYDFAAAAREAFGAAPARAKNEPYLAPEVRAEGDGGAPSDVYSIGIMLWELLTGVKAAPGGGDRPPPSEVRDDLPAGIDVVVEGLLRRAPDDRYPAAQAVEALAKVREQAERQAERTPRELRRQRARERAAERERKPLPWPITATLVGYRLVFVLLGTLLVSAITLGVGGVGFYRYLLDSMPEEVIVPDVTRMTRDKARDLITDQLGLGFTVALEQPSAVIPDGCIVTTRPAAGRRVRAGRTIEVVISTGHETVTVPRVMETSLADAQERLRKLGLTVGRAEQKLDERLPAGYILSQDPAPGRRVPTGTKINLAVSRGPQEEKEEPPPKPEAKPAAGSEATPVPHKLGRVRITVPATPPRSWVRVVIIDDNGERTVYNQMHYAGEVIVRNVEGVGKTTIEVFLNDEKVETKTL